MAILFLTVIPVCSYPIASRKRDKEDARNNQRNMAFIFNFLSYLVAMLISYCVGCTRMLQWILNGYFLSVLVLTIVNKVLKIRASGHAGIFGWDYSCVDNICRNLLDVMIMIDDIIEMNKSLYSKALKNI